MFVILCFNSNRDYVNHLKGVEADGPHPTKEAAEAACRNNGFKQVEEGLWQDTVSIRNWFCRIIEMKLEMS